MYAPHAIEAVRPRSTEFLKRVCATEHQHKVRAVLASPMWAFRFSKQSHEAFAWGEILRVSGTESLFHVSTVRKRA